MYLFIEKKFLKKSNNCFLKNQKYFFEINQLFYQLKMSFLQT